MESTVDDKRIRYPKSAVPRPAAYPAIALPPPSVPVAVRRRRGYHRRRLGRASLTSIQANLTREKMWHRLSASRLSSSIANMLRLLRQRFIRLHAAARSYGAMEMLSGSGWAECW